MTSNSDYGLARLIDPVDPKLFEQDYWEQRPLLVSREDPDYYTRLLSLDDVDRLLTLSGPTFENIRVVVSGKETPIREVGKRGKYGTTNALEAIYDHYRSGSTVVLNSLDDRWEPLQRLMRTLGAELSAGFQVNVYLTPGGNAQGFNPHYDTHDVFVAQVYGTKRWRLYGTPYELPLKERPHGKYSSKTDPAAEPEREIHLKAGDLLYLPRGTVHAASSTETASIHLTIGVHPMLWSSVIQDALADLFENDVRFRRGFPIGFANDPGLCGQAAKTLGGLLDAVRESLSPEPMVERAVTQAVSLNSPVLRGHLSDLEQLGAIGPDTVLRRRTELRAHVTTTDTSVRVDFHNKTVELPVQVRDEVRFVVSGGQDGFTATQIPGGLDDAGRMVLVRTFLREGLLTL